MEDPYQVLNLEPNASIEEVKKAYYYVAQIYHPNKGGSEEQFLRFQRAYQQIVQAYNSGSGSGNVQTPKSFMQLKQGGEVTVDHQFRPGDFRAGQGQFDASKFNRNFGSQREQRDAYTYDIENLDIPDRQEADYRREYAQVTAEAEGIVPMFNEGQFDNQTFHKVFVHMQEQHKEQCQDVEEYGDPVPSTSHDIVPYTDINDPKGNNVQNTYNQAYNTHQNPEGFQKDYLEMIKQRPDIAVDKGMSQSEIRRRMNQYQSAKLEYNKEKLITDQTVALQNVPGLESAKSDRLMMEQRMRLQNDMRPAKQFNAGVDNFDRMLSLRAPAVGMPMGQGSALPMVDRPQATSFNHRRDTHGMMHQPAAVLAPQGTPPPVYKKAKIHKKHRSSRTGGSGSENVREELRKVKRVVKHQQRAIKQLMQSQGRPTGGSGY